MLNIFGVGIHLYGLILGIGIWIGFEMVLKRSGKDRSTLEAGFWWVLTGGVIGARLYHVIDFWSRYYSANFVKIFYVWEGGLGIWGAIVGGMLGLHLFSRLKKRNFVTLLDKLIIGVPLAQAVGRLGNLANGELYGKNGEPLFAYEAVLNLILFAWMWKINIQNRRSGYLSGIYLIGYGVIRVLLEGMRPSDIIWRIGGVPTAVIFGVVSIVVGLFLIRNNLMDSRSVRE